MTTHAVRGDRMPLHKSEPNMVWVPKKRPAFGIKAYFQEFCDTTTIHGWRYIGEKNRHFLERALWLGAFLLSLAASLFLIGRAWTKWQQSPIVVTLEETLRPIWQVPFPAVTICPEAKMRTSQFKYTEMYYRNTRGRISDMERRVLTDMSLLCEGGLSGENLTTDSTAIETMEHMALDIDEFVNSVIFKGGKLVKNDFIQPILTEDGICYSFNMLYNGDMFPNNTFHGSRPYLDYSRGSSNWTVDGYRSTDGIHTYPMRAVGAGVSSGLFIEFATATNEMDYICRASQYGFRIHLHGPADFPQVGQHYFHVPFYQDVVVTVTPNMLSTSPELRDYLPQRRQCYFASERQLHFFRVYTLQNCLVECLANYTLTECGCVAFYMPREISTPICGLGRKLCVVAARELMLQSEVQGGLQNGVSGQGCDCLQSCTSVQYQTERSQADVEWRKLVQIIGGNLHEGLYVARLSISFKDTLFTGSRRSELYGQTDFLAVCGGLLGLGMGVSVLSLVELLYWLLLRMFFRSR